MQAIMRAEAERFVMVLAEFVSACGSNGICLNGLKEGSFVSPWSIGFGSNPLGAARDLQGTLKVTFFMEGAR